MSEQYQKPLPTCPHCDYEMTHDDMSNQREDLYLLPVMEESVCLTCPSCDAEYWVFCGYTPHYTSAFSEEELL